MAFEVLDKDLEDDSDSNSNAESEVNEWDSDEAETVRKGKSTQQAFAGLSLGQKMPAAPSVLVNGKDRRIDSEGDEEDDDDESGDDDNPFGDINAVHTPKEERPGMTW